MAAARAYRTDVTSLQDTLDRLDSEGFDLFQVLLVGVSRGLPDLVAVGVPREEQVHVELVPKEAALPFSDLEVEFDAARGDGRGGT